MALDTRKDIKMNRDEKEALVFMLDTYDLKDLTNQERQYLIKLVENDLNG
jgi:hypothetical protein